MGSQQQVSNTPLSLRDRWQTPDYLYDWAYNNLYPFDIDLAADPFNAKCDLFLTAKDDSLSLDWHKSKLSNYGWINPPYSEVGKWLKKASEEVEKGFTSVLLVPTPNGENYWRDFVFGKASKIVFINGRVAFETPVAMGKAVPVSGNTRGSCFVVFDDNGEGETLMQWIDRDEVKGVKYD